MGTFSPLMQPFREVKHTYHRFGLALLALLAAMLLPSVPAFILWRLHPEWSYGLPGLAIVLPTGVAFVWSIFRTARTVDARQWRWTVNQDAVALGETPNLDRHVGVSYLNAMARLSANWAWDRGFLSIRDGMLVFHGFASSFELPLDLIQGVSLPWSAYIGGPPAVVLEWLHPDGEKEWIVFHIVLDASRKATEKRARVLVEWIEEAALDQVVGEPELPFRSSAAEGAVDYDGKQVPMAAKIRAFALGAGFMALWSIGMGAVAAATHGRYPGFMGVFGMFGAAAIYFITVRRAYQRDKEKRGSDDTAGA
jgi:hypothetical protein